MNSPPSRVALVAYALGCGGVSTFLFRLGRHLSRSGLEVELLTTEEPGVWFDMAADYGLRARHIAGLRERTRVAHTIAVGQALVAGNYDAILLNHVPHAQRSIGMLPDSVLVIPIVHGDDEPIYSVACSNRNAWNILVTPGPKLHAVAQLRVPDRPVVMIPHGVAIPEQKALRIDERGAAPFRLVFLGRLDETHKGLSLLPAILRICVNRGIDARLTIAGSGPDADALPESFRRAGLEERVDFAGALRPADAYRLLLDSHVLLFPSTREGSPLVPLEAQACGCVPVCSHLRGVTDATLEDRRTGFLVPSGDATAFADAIACLAADRPRWMRIAEAAHAAASSQFRLETMGERYRQLLLDGWSNRYPLRGPRHWHRPVDLDSLLGEGFLAEGIRRAARWWRNRPRS